MEPTNEVSRAELQKKVDELNREIELAKAEAFLRISEDGQSVEAVSRRTGDVVERFSPNEILSGEPEN